MGTLLGKQIGAYKINKLLGKGGMGEVYLATDEQLDRHAALKVLKPELSADDNFIARFTQEAKTLAKFNHAHIATLYTILKDQGNFIMAMEYIDGVPLDEYLKEKGSLSTSETISIIAAILDGLAHAHEKDIVHRDLKPSNVMFNKSGTVKVMDFGIARGQKDDRHTKTGMIIGTLDYMAPELIKGEDASYASDLYAIGIIMYQALSGRMPFNTTSEYSLMQAHIKAKPTSIQQYNRNIPKPIAKYIARLLEKNPAKRFASTKEALQALKNLEQYASTMVGHAAATPTKATGGFATELLEKIKPNALYIAFGLSLLFLVGIAISRFAGADTASPSAPHEIIPTEVTPGGGQHEFTPPVIPPTAAGTAALSKADQITSLITKGEQLKKDQKYLGAYPSLYLVAKQILELNSSNKTALAWIDFIVEHYYKLGLQAYGKKQSQDLNNSISVLENIAANDKRLQQLTDKRQQLAARTKKRKATPPVVVDRGRQDRQGSSTQATGTTKPTERVHVKQDPKPSPKSETKAEVVKTPSKAKKEVESIKEEAKRPKNSERTASINEGSSLLLKINQTVSTDMDLRVGQSLDLSLAQPIEGLSAGVSAKARIINFKGTAKGKKALIEIKIASIQGPDGQVLPVKRGTIYLPAKKKGIPVTIDKGSTFKVYATRSITFKY